ncbi:hypothetical protein MMC28_008759 [Mycoblastus sanguinarius]|nr:hypothetical protein [Mycoblastus sanguinarius]
MRRFTLTALAAGLLASGSTAIHLVQRDTSPGVIGLNIHRNPVQNPVKRDAIRRRQTISETLDNEETLYFANVSIGTPAQNLRLHIDTGSSDMWANTKTSDICTYRGENLCANAGTYNANSSSTYKYVSSDFNVSYVDGSGASGDYATDNLSIGGKTLTSIQFGIGYSSSSPEGILGIGYVADESQVNTNHKKAYSNVPQAMVDGGLIRSNAYSLWLDDLQASTGSILFGGVDTGKYHGELQTLPIQKEFGEYAEFIITLSGMSLTDNGKNTTLTTNLPTPVILDSGSSLAYLPDDLTTAIYNALDVQYSQKEQAAFASCSLANENITLDFTFTSPTISIPISELIIDPNSASTEDGTTSNFGGTSSSGNGGENGGGSSSNTENSSQSLCIFGIAPAEGSTPVLGDTFLRSAYVVYDLANNEISLAQTDFNSTASHISEIGTGTASVPDATPVVSAVQAAVSQSGGARIAAGASGTITVGGSSPTSTSGAMPTQAPYGSLVLAAGAAIALACT